MPNKSTQKLITKAFNKVLNALVKILIRNGITFPEISEWLKQAYVKEVKKSLEEQGEKSTLSRISVVSGIHRKDVKRLTESVPEEDDSKFEKVSFTSRLISLWVGDSTYLDDMGAPVILQKTGPLSFESLVSSISKDVRPRTVLDDLLNRGIVQEDINGYRLIQEALFPSEDIATKMAFFGRNTADHIAACEHNLRGEKPLLPERSVFYDRLSSESIEALRSMADIESKALLIKLNKHAQRLAKKDDQLPLEESHRFILGTYFYQAKDDNDA